MADCWVDIQVSSYSRKPTVSVLSIGRGSYFRDLPSVYSWGTYYPVPNILYTGMSIEFTSESCQVLIAEERFIPGLILCPQLFPLEFLQRVSSADRWGTYYPAPDILSTVLYIRVPSESCQVLISEALIILCPIFCPQFCPLELLKSVVKCLYLRNLWSRV